MDYIDMLLIQEDLEGEDDNATALSVSPSQVSSPAPPNPTQLGAVVAQLASARLSEREVPGSILGDLNVCFDFPLIRVAIALNTRKTEH